MADAAARSCGAQPRSDAAILDFASTNRKSFPDLDECVSTPRIVNPALRAVTQSICSAVSDGRGGFCAKSCATLARSCADPRHLSLAGDL